MRPARLLLPLAGALALAGCTADSPERLLSPTSPRAFQAASRSRYLVLAKIAGFGTDFSVRVAALGGTVESQHEGAGFAIVSGLSSDAAAQLVAAGSVSEVQQDTEITLDSPIPAIEADMAAVGDVNVASASAPATAILASWQWNMRAIGADAAWKAKKLGDRTVTVAILDTGLDYDNRDLTGLVDQSRSTSFVPSDEPIRAKLVPMRKSFTDFNGHGTNVAAQVSSKAFAFAGVTSQTTLLAVKVLGGSGSGSLGGVLNGVLWAADKDADVANMSLGGGFAKAGNGRYVSLINRVFNYANKKGMLIVVAAGNESADLDHNGNYNATYCDQPHVVCVAATGPELATSNPDNSAFFTNFGRSAVSVAAPGGNADAAHFDPKTGYPLSKWPWGTDFASWVWSFCSRDKLLFDVKGKVVVPEQLGKCTGGSNLSGFIGTSQAAPHVAGLAALLVAEQGHDRPQQIKHAIEQSALDLGQPGTDPFYGRGRLNVAKALGL